MKARAVLALVVALSLPSCGGDTKPSSAGTKDAPTTYEPSAGTSDRPDVDSGLRVVEPEPGLENVIPTAWQKAKVASDGRSARVIWYSGVEECYGLDHTDVVYTETTIEITLFSGSRPEAEACIELAEKVVTVVEFKEPAGDRELVDGALPD